MKIFISLSFALLTLSCSSRLNNELDLLSQDWQTSPYGSGGEITLKNNILKIEMGDPICGVNWRDKNIPKINYEIEFQARRIQGNDFFVGLTFPYKDSFCSLIVSGWGGTVTGLSSINELDASENETTCHLTVTNGQWYKIKLLVLDESIHVSIDDKELINVKTVGKEINIRPEVEPSCPLGLATFYTSAEYRKIKLRKLN